MIYSPPPDPPPDPPPNRRGTLGFDDFMGIFVAFTSIGAIFWWSFSQMEKGLDLSLFQTPSPSPSPTVTLTPSESPPAPIYPKITSIPSESSEPIPSVSPETARSPKVQVVPVPIPARPAQSTPTGFSDVPPGFWASPFIVVLAQRGLMEGYSDNTFKPEQPVTRAEFANILQRAFDQSKSRQAIQFKDLQSGYWANLAIAQAVQMGFMKGYPDKVFRPDQQISKAESLVALANGLKLTSTSSLEQVLSFYQDAGQIPRYAVEEVAAATTAGLVVNHPEPKTLNPQQMITRAETAALIYQALVQSGQAEKVSSTYIVQP